jgi:hypothetical protein
MLSRWRVDRSQLRATSGPHRCVACIHGRRRSTVGASPYAYTIMRVDQRFSARSSLGYNRCLYSILGRR